MTEKTTKELTYIQKSILSHLGESQMTSRQLAEKIGCSISAARNATRHLRGKGLIFVAATRRLHHGFFEKVYAAHAKHARSRALSRRSAAALRVHRACMRFFPQSTATGQ